MLSRYGSMTLLRAAWTALTYSAKCNSMPHFLPNGRQGGPPGGRSMQRAQTRRRISSRYSCKRAAVYMVSPPHFFEIETDFPVGLAPACFLSFPSREYGR